MSTGNKQSHLLDPTWHFYTWEILSIKFTLNLETSNINCPMSLSDYPRGVCVLFPFLKPWIQLGGAQNAPWSVVQVDSTPIKHLWEWQYLPVAETSDTFLNTWATAQNHPLFMKTLSLVVFSGSPTHFQPRFYLPGTTTHIFQLLTSYNGNIPHLPSASSSICSPWHM